MKPLLIVRTASSYDDLPELCRHRGDEVRWFSDASGAPIDTVVSVDAYKDEPLPDPEDVQAIIITGSIGMISDDLPWMRTAVGWLKEAVDKQVPILGVCFGHQLLALATNGTVGKNPNGAEFGAVEMTKSAAADEDPLFVDIPKNFGMYVFHYESVLQLPENAVLLASSAHEPHHAFRYGKNAWGVQFHPEFDPEIMDHAISVYRTDMEAAGYDVDTLRANHVDPRFGKALLKNFVNVACVQRSPERVLSGFGEASI